MASSSRRQQGSRHAHTPALFARSPNARALRCEALEDRRMLALLTVTSDQDVVDFDDGQISLREAIFAANLVPGADEIQFDFGHDGPATILLTEGELSIEDSLTITGPGAELLTIDARGIATVTSSSIFNISDGKATIIDASIYGLTLTGAQNSAIRNRENLTLTSMMLTGNTSTAGGALWMESSFNNQITSLNIIDTSFVDNTSTGSGGGAIYFQGDRDQIAIRDSQFLGNNAESTTRSRGGAISIQGLENQVEIVDTQIKNNSATEGGGVHVVRSGNVRIVDSDISQNTAWAQGGGINAEGGILQIERSTVAENVAGNDLFSGTGGGLWFSGGVGEAVINESMISGNSATSRGGGIGGASFVVINSTLSQNSSYDGGAIYAGNLRLLNSTISGNSADREGGGIFSGDIPKVINSTIVDNSAGYRGGGISAKGFELEDSVVAKNSAPIRPDASHAPLILSWIRASHSLIGFFDSQYLTEAPIGSPDANGNLIGGPIHGTIDPLLGLLIDNGGPTLTHALLPGSPAINAGDPTPVTGVGDTPAFDQRGEPFRRIAEGRIDIGAFEAQSLIVDTLVDESDGDFSAGDFSLREAVKLANQFPGLNKIEFASSLAGGTISLIQGEIAISDAVEIVGLGADLLTIDASGSDPTPDINNGDGSRVFNVDAVGPVQISRVHITGGDTLYEGGGIRTTSNLVLNESLLTKNFSGIEGGAIQAFLDGEVTLVIDSCDIDTNWTNSLGGRGAGIAVRLFNNSRAVIANSVVISNLLGSLLPSSVNFGGGLFASLENESELHLLGSTFDKNSGGYGGGAYIDLRGDNQITIKQSSFSYNVGNSSASFGLNAGFNSSVNIESSTFQNNQSRSEAIGISASGSSSIQIKDSSISNTTGGRGLTLGLQNSSRLRLENVTIAGNTSNSSGGGAFAILRHDSLLVLESCTISGNTSLQNGGGIGFRASGANRVEISNSTITNNSSIGNRGSFVGGLYIAVGGLFLENTIIANNHDQSGIAPDIGGYSLDQINVNYSLIGTNAGTTLSEAHVSSTTTNGNLIGGPIYGLIDPLLGPLADNSGPTLTHALLPGSPAINAGDPYLVIGGDGIPEFDQRGAPFTRIAGLRIDIGAYESQPAAGLLNGDFDGDGDVDGRDFLAWQRGAGTTPADKADGDATGNNIVNSQDLAVWQETYGRSGLTALQLALMIDHEVTDSVALLAVEVPREISMTLSDETVSLGFQAGAITDEKPTEDFDFSAIASELLVDETTWDTAFDNWLPQRAAFDFGDIATRRAVRRSGLVISR